jgi:hypothetical protein
MGIPFVVVYTLAVARRALAFVHARQSSTALSILVVCSLAGLILYAAGNELPMGFPRYHYPIFLLMVLLVSHYLAGFKLADTRDRCLLLIAAVACVAYFALVIPDPLLPQYELTFETNDVLQRLAFGLRSQVIAFVIPFAVVWIALWARSRNGAGAFRTAAVTFCLASWCVLTVTQAQADYATIYEYGRRGAAEVSAIVRERTDSTDTIVAPMEIIFASQRSGSYLLKFVGPKANAQTWLERFRDQPPQAYVLTTKEDGRYTQVTRAPEVVEMLDRCYTERIDIGSYLVYFRITTPCK